MAKCSTTAVEVPPALAGRVRSVVQSMALQRKHNELAGQSCAFARGATRAAKPLLQQQAYKAAMRAHDRANVAKHSWADAWSDSDAAEGPSPPPLSGDTVHSSSSPTLRGAPVLDDVGRPSSAFETSASPPLSGDTFLQKRGDVVDARVSLSADAQVFVPACGAPSPTALDAWQTLVDAQNSTIKTLLATLEAWQATTFTKFDGIIRQQFELLNARVAALEGRLDQLCNSRAFALRRPSAVDSDVVDVKPGVDEPLVSSAAAVASSSPPLSGALITVAGGGSDSTGTETDNAEQSGDNGAVVQMLAALQCRMDDSLQQQQQLHDRLLSLPGRIGESWQRH